MEPPQLGRIAHPSAPALSLGENNLRFAGGEAQAPVLLFCDDSVARFCDKNYQMHIKVQTGVGAGVAPGVSFAKERMIWELVTREMEISFRGSVRSTVSPNNFRTRGSC